eukprot:1180627-Prorocentrum_minimum.AAC.2
MDSWGVGLDGSPGGRVQMDPGWWVPVDPRGVGPDGSGGVSLDGSRGVGSRWIQGGVSSDRSRGGSGSQRSLAGPLADSPTRLLTRLLTQDGETKIRGRPLQHVPGSNPPSTKDLPSIHMDPNTMKQWIASLNDAGLRVRSANPSPPRLAQKRRKRTAPANGLRTTGPRRYITPPQKPGGLPVRVVTEVYAPSADPPDEQASTPAGLANLLSCYPHRAHGNRLYSSTRPIVSPRQPNIPRPDQSRLIA